MQACAKPPRAAPIEPTPSPVAPNEPTQPPVVLPSTNATTVPSAAEPAPVASATSLASRTTDAPSTDGSTANRGSWKRWTGLGLGGVGLGTLGVGVAFSLRAHQLEDEVAALCSETCSYEDERVVTADRDGRAASRNAVVSYVVGGAMLSAGVALFIWSIADAGARHITRGGNPDQRRRLRQHELDAFDAASHDLRDPVAVAIGASGCYSPAWPACHVACGANNACPGDLHCNAALGVCEGARACELVLDAGTDGPVAIRAATGRRSLRAQRSTAHSRPIARSGAGATTRSVRSATAAPHRRRERPSRSTRTPTGSGSPSATRTRARSAATARRVRCTAGALATIIVSATTASPALLHRSRLASAPTGSRSLRAAVIPAACEEHLATPSCTAGGSTGTVRSASG